MSNGQDITRRLADLLREPRETLDVELKGWLDISNNAEHRATLAKALIALANHGGGYVVFGFAETEDGVVPAEPRPENLATYTPDTVNSVVSRYIEPPFHCDVQVITSPETDLDHPVVSVPGGHTAPIRSKRSGPEGRIIEQNCYYIRRPGPCSEPPQSGQEWDVLIGRCLANAREDLVDRFRVIMAGGTATEVPETDLDPTSALRGPPAPERDRVVALRQQGGAELPALRGRLGQLRLLHARGRPADSAWRRQAPGPVREPAGLRRRPLHQRQL